MYGLVSFSSESSHFPSRKPSNQNAAKTVERRNDDSAVLYKHSSYSVPTYPSAYLTPGSHRQDRAQSGTVARFPDQDQSKLELLAPC